MIPGRPQPALAKPSASIVMLRQEDDVLEVLMVKRRAGDAFGDSYAFPGGLVDSDEHVSHQYADDICSDTVNAQLGQDEGLNYYSAAIRELFEEAGILLVREDLQDLSISTQALRDCRSAVDRGRMRWSDFLQQNSLHMACSALHYFAWWETPLEFDKRWTTRFFLAVMPAGQAASQDGNELTDICWMSAADVLATSKAGAMKLPYPTMRILQDLECFKTVAEALAWADRQAAKSIELTRTKKIERDGKVHFVIKGDPGFPEDDGPNQ